MSPSAPQAAWLVRTVDGSRFIAEQLDRDGGSIRFVGRRADKGGPYGRPREYMIPVGRLQFARRDVAS